MERKSFPLRIDAQLWKELESWAQDELRSINGQIEYLLRQAVQKRKGKMALEAPQHNEPAKSPRAATKDSRRDRIPR